VLPLHVGSRRTRGAAVCRGARWSANGSPVMAADAWSHPPATTL